MTAVHELKNQLRIGHLRFEKCELREAEKSFLQAFDLASRLGEDTLLVEALVALLRFAGESLDEDRMRRWSLELQSVVDRLGEGVPPLAWYGMGFVAAQRESWREAQAHYHRYLKALRRARHDDPASFARGMTMFANAALQRGRPQRAKLILETVLSRYESLKLRGINGVAYIIRGLLEEWGGDCSSALDWYKKAHGSFLEEHNWYHHLYVLYGYARIARLQQSYSQANWYLDLMEKAATAPEFGVLRREITRERRRLEDCAIDIMVDGVRGVIRTRERGDIPLGKQYVLLDILRALSKAHQRAEEDTRGLSKAEIIEQVWREHYRPEAHDNKLYYNINRLRKLIEPDVRRPQYVLNWKEGYRFSPGLRIHFLSQVEKARGEA